MSLTSNLLIEVDVHSMKKTPHMCYRKLNRIKDPQLTN